MAPVPLPASPCVRVRLIYEPPAANEAGSRFYLSYSGSAPTAANCSTLASDIEAAWVSHMAGLTPVLWSLNEVDVLDIASDDGLSGQWTGTEDGTRSGPGTPQQVATNVEFDIARRYRGGKPRMFLPPGVAADTANENEWNSTFIGEVNTGLAAFIEEIEALTVGAMGTLAHVNLSYYKGYNTTSPPWRGPGFKYPPKYRDAALLDSVEGYSTKAIMGSQKRRRTSTTP